MEQDIQTLAYSADGRPTVISFEAAKALREQGRAFVHKPASLQKPPMKMHSPAELAKVQGFDFDGDGPEAA